MSMLHHMIGLVLLARHARDERGLSQSTEQAILLAGVVTVALGIVALVGTFVTNQLSGLG